ncbi:shikimate kinase [Paenibacillus algorifonticola]|uniref:Shikimate kinase n=1 Tax=Paenibacillus algorifonticola TaxID=684063 RepID=A0A1I2CSZ4_9BACL|nr:AAA family ATPase [Paenibacillus algorifonticola]SFE70913.1 shikimate kinase [Paenibacillus algorifonticola]
MRKLVFFLGGAGAGKTTLAKALARRKGAAIFDMDTLLRPAAEAIMTASGLDPKDRDSELYKVRCRDLGYRITMDAALENVAIGTDALVIGPFTKETADPLWIEQELSAIGASLRDVAVRVVLVSLRDQELHRSRIQERGLELDEWKLGNWEAFSRSLGPRKLNWPIPASSVLDFDNSGELNEEKMLLLERFVYGDDIVEGE